MPKRIKRRVVKKRLSEVTATLADGVEVFRRRPRNDPEIEEIYRGILSLNLGLVIYWRGMLERKGREGDRWLKQVDVTEVHDDNGHLSIAGDALWSVRGPGGEAENRISYRVEIPSGRGRFTYTLLGGT